MHLCLLPGGPAPAITACALLDSLKRSTQLTNPPRSRGVRGIWTPCCQQGRHPQSPPTWPYTVGRAGRSCGHKPTSNPRRARNMAAVLPAGPAPTITAFLPLYSSATDAAGAPAAAGLAALRRRGRGDQGGMGGVMAAGCQVACACMHRWVSGQQAEGERRHGRHTSRCHW